MHKAVYQRVVYFRREFGYSFVQWDGTDSSKNRHEEARAIRFRPPWVTDVLAVAAAIINRWAAPLVRVVATPLDLELGMSHVNMANGVPAGYLV